MGQAGRDDQSIRCVVSEDRRPQIAAALLVAAFGLFAHAPSPVAVRETITVEGNRRVDAETVRSYFHPVDRRTI